MNRLVEFHPKLPGVLHWVKLISIGETLKGCCPWSLLMSTDATTNCILCIFVFHEKCYQPLVVIHVVPTFSIKESSEDWILGNQKLLQRKIPPPILTNRVGQVQVGHGLVLNLCWFHAIVHKGA